MTPVRRRPNKSPAQGQLDLGLAPAEVLHLTDKIVEPMHTLFVGISPATRSAEVGHYYAAGSNFFWKLIHHSGIWPYPITAVDDDLLVAKGFGFTDMVKRPASGSHHLDRSDFTDSKRRLKALAERFKPKTVVFVGKRAIAAYSGAKGSKISYGLQTTRFAGCDVFHLPSTSAASQGDTSYPEKLRVFRELRAHIAKYCNFAPSTKNS
jgi:double-stranded uracil-DNA glycosylase